MTIASAADSVAELARRLQSIPGALEVAARTPLPAFGGGAPRSVVTTGIGASEGPARLLAFYLLDQGVAARFLPLARFKLERPEADLLVAFSQNLSPNARLGLPSEHRFGARWLVTSLGFGSTCAAALPLYSERERLLEVLSAQGVIPIVVPPEREDGMLARVVGPTVATLIALRIAAALGAGALANLPFEQAAKAYASARAMPTLGTQPVSLIAAGPPVELLRGQGWKLLETLLQGDPPVWDVLQFAHGPLQWLHEREACLLALATPDACELLDRLASLLSPPRHRLIRFVATRCDALSFFEHSAAIDGCILATLTEHARDLFDWPKRGADGALYRLGEDCS